MKEKKSSVKGFFLYFDQYEPIKLLSMEQKGMLLEAMFAKFSGGEYEITDPVVLMAFGFMEHGFKLEQDKYFKICEKRRENIKKRWDTKNTNVSLDDTKDTSVYKSIQTDTSVYKSIQTDTNVYKGIQTIPYPDPDLNPDPDPDKNIYGAKSPGHTSQRFTPPSLEDVQAYCRERGNHVDAQRFIDFYASKGWMVGKNRMKDWKACVRTWEQGSTQTMQLPLTNMARDPNRCASLPKPPGWK